MSDSSDIQWPDFAGTYDDAFGPIDADIFEAGRALWPRAVNLSKSLEFDQEAAQTALIKTCAKVTAARARGSTVESLQSYLFLSYKRELFVQIRTRGRFEVLNDEHEESLEPSSGLTLDDQILIEEILSRMRPPARRIYGGLILGYTYEEMAKWFGTQSNVLRSVYSKEIERIRKEIEKDETGEDSDQPGNKRDPGR